MTIREAKEVLSLYRPGTADAEDDSFAEALRLCEQDAELRSWFEDRCGVYQALRTKLRRIPVPEGLQEQILAERKINTPTFWRQPRHRVLTASFAVVVASIFLILQWHHPEENTGVPGFRERMINRALRSYGMDLESENLQQVRNFLAERKSVSDYSLPPGLQTAKLVGCVVTTWQGKPVSMICFKSGRPLSHAQKSDLWLFVAENSSVSVVPTSSKPRFDTIRNATAATWSEKGKTYVLAVEGDVETLKRFL
ncbi:MAG TPA: hypothetical protein VK327_11565 [Candidatus Paceibacterota bacterium]|nr:hypothetical protein [Candidatus Paceibacterota bacterium]